MNKNSKTNKTSLTAISQRDKSKIRWILRRVDNKEAFLYSLVTSLLVSCEKKNTQEFRETLQTWEASAEIDSIPGAKERIWKAYEKYRATKTIDRNWSKFKKEIGVI